MAQTKKNVDISTKEDSEKKEYIEKNKRLLEQNKKLLEEVEYYKSNYSETLKELETANSNVVENNQNSQRIDELSNEIEKHNHVIEKIKTEYENLRSFANKRSGEIELVLYLINMLILQNHLLICLECQWLY